MVEMEIEFECQVTGIGQGLMKGPNTATLSYMEAEQITHISNSNKYFFSLGEIKKPAKFVSGKKSPNKPKIRGNNEKKNRKKKSPCEGKFKNFCVHGECKYIKDIQAPTCKCHQDYFGERCIEQFLKTQRSNDAAGHSTTVLMVHSTTVLVKAAVGLSVLSFIVIVIIVIVQVRKKCPKYDEKEERKKLQQDNASSSNGV
uniref:EGF-like domain-containing protein n=1 Tax=Varanus komodoensis TaxID=61221 RepID=A0A8D2LNB8_VARKO